MTFKKLLFPLAIVAVVVTSGAVTFWRADWGSEPIGFEAIKARAIQEVQKLYPDYDLDVPDTVTEENALIVEGTQWAIDVDATNLYDKKFTVMLTPSGRLIHQVIEHFNDLTPWRRLKDEYRAQLEQAIPHVTTIPNFTIDHSHADVPLHYSMRSEKEKAFTFSSSHQLAGEQEYHFGITKDELIPNKVFDMKHIGSNYGHLAFGITAASQNDVTLSNAVTLITDLKNSLETQGVYFHAIDVTIATQELLDNDPTGNPQAIIVHKLRASDLTGDNITQTIEENARTTQRVFGGSNIAYQNLPNALDD